MKEKAFEGIVKRWLSDHGCWWLKTFSNGIQRAGVPDILACVNGHFVGLELKNETGRASKLQLWNIDKIKESGGFAAVVNPQNWDDVKNELERMIDNEYL